jgi:hypothetical protein
MKGPPPGDKERAALREQLIGSIEAGRQRKQP